ncbi:hypothetical protein SELMODRAFT_444214 [Selaginella moellendorffii]|uniref:Aminoglycoside phosphotransferase domain-containing protein n=1 Tax=Selaginella moellendorffii TaxID=88036 RepID=D8S7Y3_SELML|nr:hypothetical protein SELMODRAFT_444214 [Selaginella moellendorffii]
MAELRDVIFESFLCLPSQLERMVSRILGCAVQFTGILGMGGWNLVLDAHKGDQRVAIRLPLAGQKNRITSALADSGYAATLFLSGLGIQTVVAGPVHVASPPLPYTPRGKSHLTVMPVAEGVPAWELWRKGASVEWKKTVLADLAGITVRLYHRPLDSMGGMAVDCAGACHVGPEPQSPVSQAMERGLDVGALSPGPYSSWKEYARNHIGGLMVLHGNSRRYGESIRANAAILLRWLDEFQESREGSGFFLHHPDFGPTQVLVDPASGHVKCILDWDGAKTGTVQSLATSFFLPAYFCKVEDEEEDEELFGFFKQQLIQGGAAEVAALARRHWTHKSCDPQVVFEEEMDVPCRGGAKSVQIRLERLCRKMQKLGIVDGQEEVVCTSPPWSRTPSSWSSSDEEGETDGEDMAEKGATMSDDDEPTGSSCSESESIDLDLESTPSPSASSREDNFDMRVMPPCQFYAILVMQKRVHHVFE